MAKKIPLRQCTGCQEMKPKDQLVRIIKTPENEILLDKKGKMNGRGAYICCKRECFEKAYKTKGIERSLKVFVPKEIYETINKELIADDN